jgi:hypothetical protein
LVFFLGADSHRLLWPVCTHSSSDRINNGHGLATVQWTSYIPIVTCVGTVAIAAAHTHPVR